MIPSRTSVQWVLTFWWDITLPILGYTCHCSSIISITVYQTTRYHNPEHYNINSFIKHLAYPLSVSRHQSAILMRDLRLPPQLTRFWDAARLPNFGTMYRSYLQRSISPTLFGLLDPWIWDWCCQETTVTNKSEEQTLLPYWYFIHYHRRYVISATDSVVK